MWEKSFVNARIVRGNRQRSSAVVSGALHDIGV